MPRSTIEVAYIVERGNYFLAHSDVEQREQRLGVCSMIELALYKTGNYNGYSHLESAGIPQHWKGKPFSYIDMRDEYHNPTSPRLRMLSADDDDGFARFIAHAISDGGWYDHMHRWHAIDDSRRVYAIKGHPWPNTRVSR